MGKRGPPPQPSILKYIRGNPSKDPVNPDEPTPDLVPEWLEPTPLVSASETATAHWRRVVPMLSSMRVLTEADIPTIERYCIAWSRYLVCLDRVNKLGEDYIHYEPDPNRPGSMRIKYTQVAPWATQMHRWDAVLLRIEREFGMTSASRSQVRTEGNGRNPTGSALVAYGKSRRRQEGA